jgi:hypothetical protein
MYKLDTTQWDSVQIDIANNVPLQNDCFGIHPQKNILEIVYISMMFYIRTLFCALK